MVYSLSGALILSIAYGYQVEHATPDPLVRFVEYTMHKLHESAIPGKWLVDIIPIRTLLIYLAYFSIIIRVS